MSTPTMWSKSNPAWGQRRRVQRNYYAYLVSMAMTANAIKTADVVCPACLAPMDLDTAEVDKAIPSLDYAPGSICYLCRGCNQSRSVLQSVGKDWTYVDMYVADVARASAGIAIPTEAEAKAWHQTRKRSPESVSRYA